MQDKYITTIGLEIHVQLSTASKMFSRADNDSDKAEPNTNVLPLCMGYPGTLPVINAHALEFGMKGALALGCTINTLQRFDRKNYFYPDLPKGYQISQFFHPMGEHGKVVVDYLAPDRKTKKEFTVGITRLHLEEDAGKLVHTKDATLVDLNRCGTPLAEIVTEPDITSPEEARAFLQELQRIVRSIGISKADMEKGHLRCDANVSVRLKGQKEFGSKVEVKNINSFKFVEKALSFEVERQIEILENGGEVEQSTRGWDEKTSSTVEQRGKEGSVDYRYFPEPDLPPIIVEAGEIERVKASLVELPRQLRERAETAGIPYNRVTELQDTGKLGLAVAVLGTNAKLDAKLVANWAEKFDSEETLVKFVTTVAENQLSATAAQTYFETGEIPKQGDTGDLRNLIVEVLTAEKETVGRYKAGEEKLFGYLTGQVMAKLKGAGEPAMVQQILKEELNK